MLELAEQIIELTNSQSQIVVQAAARRTIRDRRKPDITLRARRISAGAEGAAADRA